MTHHLDVEIVPEDDASAEKRPDHREEGVEVPLDRIDTGVLRNLIAEFVTREWEELGDYSSTLDEKIAQVEQQLRQKKARVVFDLTTNSCNIVSIP